MQVQQIPEWLSKANAEAERRFQAVTWVAGKWYGIHDDDEAPGSMLFYECQIDDEGEVFLLADQPACDKWLDRDCHEARGLITSHSVVTPL